MLAAEPAARALSPVWAEAGWRWTPSSPRERQPLAAQRALRAGDSQAEPAGDAGAVPSTVCNDAAPHSSPRARRGAPSMSKKAPPAAAAAAPAGPTATPEELAERYALADELVRELRPRVAALQDEAAALAAERDKLNVSWAGVKQLAESARGEVRRRDAALEEQRAAQLVEVKMHKQRVRELLAGNADAAVGERVGTLRALKLAGDAAIESERELKADRRDIAAALRDAEAGHDELVRVLKLESDKAITTARFTFETQARELAAFYEERMRAAREELNASREAEVAAVEARKVAHTAAMLAAHERAFADMKAYFNDITQSNLDLIKVRAMGAAAARGGCARAHAALTHLPPPPSPAVAQGGAGRHAEEGGWRREGCFCDFGGEQAHVGADAQGD